MIVANVVSFACIETIPLPIPQPPLPGGGTGGGLQGPMGPAGPAGVAGPQGIQGVPGPQGVQGFAGPQGVAGIGINVKREIPTLADLPTEGNVPGDAYLITETGDLWVYDIDTAAFVNLGHLAGPTGLQGPQGLQGTPGAQGAPGAVGPAGPAGVDGIQGIQGIPGVSDIPGPQGPIGPVGPQGPQGIQGEPGPQGPPAEMELTNATTYRLSSLTVAPPAIGEVRLSGPQNASVTMWVHHMNAKGADCANIFRVLDSSARIFLQDIDNSANYQVYRLSGNPVDNIAGGYLTMSMQWLSGSGTVPLNALCFIGL